MEQAGREPIPEIELEEALSQIYEGQMLQFNAASFRLFEFVETGESQIHSTRVGESEYDFRIPVTEPVLQKDVSSLAELFDGNDKNYDFNNGALANKIDTPEFQSWLAFLATFENIEDSVIKELARREIEGNAEIIPCANCKGAASFEVDCSCTYGGINFIDTTDETDNLTTSLREEGQPNPDCNTCEGSGKTQNNCPYCEGCGKAAKYPYIILKNEITGEERILKLDLATLIASGEVGLGWRGQEKIYQNDYQVSEKVLQFNVSAYIDKNIAEMGVDKANAARFAGNSLSRIESERANVTGQRASWRKQDGIVKAKPHDSQSDAITTNMLHDAQLSLARAYAWPYGKIKNDEGVAIAEEWVLRPLRSLEETLEDLKTAVAHHGYTLGFTHSFIATGEVGPSFFLLERDGAPLQQLSNEYSIRESLENAWLAFQNLQTNPLHLEED